MAIAGNCCLDFSSTYEEIWDIYKAGLTTSTAPWYDELSALVDKFNKQFKKKQKTGL